MVLITGGAYQGKLNYAFDITGYTESEVVDGEYCDYEEIYRGKIIYRFHEIIRRCILENEETEPMLERLFEENPDAIIIVDEVGAGVIPIEPFERQYREVVGRTSSIIAKNSTEVHRVLFGLGVKLKNA